MTKPFDGVSLCTIFHNADIEPLLRSVYGRFDGYHFTLATTADNKPNCAEAVRKVKNFLNAMKAKGYVTSFSEFEWCDDFAKARNFNFAHNTHKWAMFLDADDELVCPHEGAIRALVKNLNTTQPNVHGCFLPYDYDRNETLGTMRLFRHGDGGWEWLDAIHERAEQRAFDMSEGGFAQCTDIRVKHKFKTAEEKKAAVVRNAAIARREYALTDDERYKARLARTIAMELKMQGDAEGSIPWQENLYKWYEHFPEGKQAAADIAKAYLAVAQQKPEQAKEALAKGAEWASKAGPAYEGMLNHAQKEWTHTIKACQRSAGMGQQTTHEGYLFEQGLIYILAADAAMELNYPPEVVERLINRVVPNLRTESIIHTPVQYLSAMIDRITFVIPGTPQLFDENGGGGMLGGSEEAVMYLSRALAQAGRRVRVFTPLPPHRLPGLDKYGVDWQEISSFDIDAEHGTVVFWRAPQMVLQMMHAKASGKAIIPGIRRSYLWLHDITTGLNKDLQEIAFKGVDGVLTLSDFHQQHIARVTPGVGRYFGVANGIPAEGFTPSATDPPRDPNLVIYSSSPDRGLQHLLRMWPRVKQTVPTARLHIYYDWSMLARANPSLYTAIAASYEAVRHLDVIHFGGVDHDTLHTALKTANVWAYPHYDNITVETSCISLMKAKAAGAFPLISGAGALPETAAGWGQIVEDPSEYEKALVLQLLNPMTELERDAMRYDACERHGWANVATAFDALLTQQFDPRPVGEKVSFDSSPGEQP